MDYKEIYERSKKELSTLESRRAVLSTKINELCEKLGLDAKGDIPQQIESLKATLLEKQTALESELSKVVEELDKLKLNE